jgi:mycoredoxin
LDRIMSVTLYTKPGCPYCAALRADLMNRGLRFSEIDVTAVPGAREELAKLSGGRMVVPVMVDEDGAVKVAPGGG